MFKTLTCPGNENGKIENTRVGQSERINEKTMDWAGTDNKTVHTPSTYKDDHHVQPTLSMTKLVSHSAPHVLIST